MLRSGRFFSGSPLKILIVVSLGCGSTKAQPGADAAPSLADASVDSADGASDSTDGASDSTDGASVSGTATAGCTYDVEKVLAREDMTSFGKTVQELGDAFGVGQPLACGLTWQALGDQTFLTWSPHDATSGASLLLDWGTGATERSGGHAPAGSRSACPASVTLDLVVTLRTDDGGFDESWHLPASVSQFSQDQMTIKSDLRALGLYEFKGTYEFRWNSAWPMTYAWFLLAVYAAGPTSPLSVEGALQEASLRETVTDGGTQKGGTGDGVIAKTAAWLCPRN